MKKSMWKKGLVLGIIVLFVGASVVPSTGMVEKSTIGRSIFVHVDLIIEKSDDPDPVYAGGYLTYTLSVTHGPPNNWPASNVTVTDILPSGVTFNYANPAPTGSSDATYWWFFSMIGVGGSETIIINVTVDSGTTGTVTNLANVTTDTEEFILENNEDSEETNIISPPVAVNDTATTPEDTPVVIDVTANDYDPDGSIDPTTVTIVTDVSHGSTNVNPTNGMVTYTPDLNYHGLDSFTYEVDDDDGATSNVATVSVNVTDVNDPPVAFNDSATTPEDTPVAINVTANDYDIDGTIDVTTVTIVSGPLHGGTSVNPTTGIVTYTPDSNYHGPDSFTYNVKDNDGATSNVATVSITVISDNDPPVAVNDVASTPINTPVVIDILANDYDIDGTIDPTTVTIVADVSHGSTSVNPTNGMVTYTPDLNYFGPDYFTYTVKDNSGATSNVATVSITVYDPGRPVAVDDFAMTPMNTPVVIDILANDYDPDGAIDPTTVTIVADVSHGSTSVNPTNGMVTYTPNLDYYGPDSFYYTVKDNLGWTSNVAKVSITVVGNYPPNKPDRPSGPTRGKAGVEYTYCIINATDPDGDDIWANFSWGDGTYSGWIGPNASGEDICTSHAWEWRGNYELKAKLKDEWGLESPWSDPLPITMPLNQPSLHSRHFNVHSFIKRLML